MITFWIDKFRLLAVFIWWREWGLVREEWNLTYLEMQEAQERVDEISRDAEERLLRAIRENTQED